MVLSDSTLLTLAVAFALLALAGLGLSYWTREPTKVKRVGQIALKLILGLLSYPVVMVVIVLIFGLLLVGTLCTYTLRRVAGMPTPMVRVKVSFD